MPNYSYFQELFTKTLKFITKPAKFVSSIRTVNYNTEIENENVNHYNKVKGSPSVCLYRRISLTDKNLL